VYEHEQIEQHEVLTARIAESVRDGQLTLPLPSELGVEARFAGLHQLIAPQRLNRLDGSSWIVSRTSHTTDNGQPFVLEVRQNTFASLHHQKEDFLLLIFAVGSSAVLTSCLLSVVINRNLIKPVRNMSRQLVKLNVNLVSIDFLLAENYLTEFRPIVRAFNVLQIRLQNSLRRERQFIDGVVHELRAPISVILAHGQRLQVMSPPKTKDFGDLIAKECKRADDLISVMRDLSRSDAGNLSLAIEDLDPELLLLESFERLQDLAPHRLQLAPSVEENLPRIQADSERLHQCLAALSQNALYYSEGTVQLGVAASSYGVTLHVRDQGPGIPIAEHDLVVKRFVRGSSAGKVQGSGLGLAIVNELMRAMHGQLVIAEAPGGGADMQLLVKASGLPNVQ